MSSNKEKEILERQRLLAAQFHKKPSSSSSSSAHARPAPKPPPPKRPSVKKASSSSSNNAVIDLTRSSSSSSSAAAAPPRKKRATEIISNSSKNGNKIRKKDETQLNRKPAAAPQIRPTLKRPGTAKTSSALIAAARAKANNNNSTSSSSSLKVNLGKTQTASGKSDKNEDLPSPKLQRKTVQTNKVSSFMGSGALANLVKSAQKQNNNDGDNVAMKQSLKVHYPDDFWKNLRDWDLPSQYYQEMQLQQQNNPAKASSTDNINDQVVSTRKPLPNTFLNPRHYIAAWAPLCMAECRAQLLQEVAQNNSMAITSPVLVQVQSTTSRVRHRSNNNNNNSGVDAPWLEENETGGYVMVQPKERQNSNLSFMPNDLVLLIQPQYKNILRDIGNGNATPLDATNGASAMAGISLIGHTESARRELKGLILKVSKRKWAVIGKKEMYLVKIGSNVTALREFTALCGVDTLPMKQFLLGQHLEKEENRRKLSRHQPIEQLLHQMGGEALLGPGFLEYATQKFNPSQLTAIAAAASEYGEGGFTLLKGPPGTGKTTTLCAVLNSLHIRQYNKYHAEVARICTKPTGSGESALAMARKAKPRLLVCAPSNAAIDNIIMKIIEDGFVDGSGNRYNPSMTRVGVGRSDAVRAVSLESQVDAILSENMDAQQLQQSIAGFRSELARTSREIASLRRRANAFTSAANYPLADYWEIRIDEEEFDQVNKAYFVNHKEHFTTYEMPPPPEPGEKQKSAESCKEYKAYVSRIVKLVDKYFTMKTNLERCSLVKTSFDAGSNQFEVRMNLESHVLNSVHMVMTTLGSAGNRTLEAADRFEVIVVDEAAQSVEPASLSALRLGSRHAVLVGDPQQLPATIFNVSGRNSKYDRSLFQRLEEAGQPVYMLNEQYRMHPKISHFPRHIFYGGALLDGPNVTKPDYGEPLRSIICRAVPAFSPLMILDLDSKEERGGTSLSNLSEAKLAVYLYEQLRRLSRGLSASSKVAVITPYAQQCRLLRQSFESLLGPRYETFVEVNTVDAFQGREANIVIFSAVRAAGSRGIGFLSDVRRMNVALTRAKHFLFVIARCESVVVNPYWSDFVTHARETQAVVRVPMLGSGNTASFADISTWQREMPSVAAGATATPAEDPRKKRMRC